MLNQVEDIALQHQSKAVASITLGIGPLSGVESKLLINAYSIASAGTVAEHAELIIENLPIRVRCNDCGKESEALAKKRFTIAQLLSLVISHRIPMDKTTEHVVRDIVPPGTEYGNMQTNSINSPSLSSNVRQEYTCHALVDNLLIILACVFLSQAGPGS